MNLHRLNLKYPGETLSLLLSFSLVFILAFWLFDFNVWIFLLLLVAQLIYVLATQRQFMGNALLVTQNQFPNIHEIVIENTKDLNISEPKVFIEQNPFINAYTVGFRKPYSIVLTSTLVEALTRDELDFVIGHEMGHIKFNHARTLSFVSPLGNDIPFLSILYGSWQRKAEYTADRVGLLLTKKIKPAITAMIKMAVGNKLSTVINFEEIIRQIEESRKGLTSGLGEFLLTHPYITNRIQELVEYNHGNFNSASNIIIEEKNELKSKNINSLFETIIYISLILVGIYLIYYMLQ